MATALPDDHDDDHVPEIPDFIPDSLPSEEFLTSGPKEPSADERAAKAARIARENDRLRKAGQISDGSGKPAYRRTTKVAPWVGIGAAIAVLVLVVALLAR